MAAMHRVALKMLLGDRAKFLALVIGLSFSVLLIAQQGSIFLGLLLRSTGVLQNIDRPDLWVADEQTTYIGEYRPMKDEVLLRVRSIPGVAWAEPFFTTRATIELPDGQFRTGQLLGIDRSTLVGQPPQMTAGRIDDLRIPDAVIVEEASREKLGGVELGQTLKLNDRRALVVGFCRAKTGFESNALIYSTYENARSFVPTGRDTLSYILVKTKPDASIPDVQQAINRLPAVAALTKPELREKSVRYILKNTGIGINFGITVTLGLIVGLVIAAATFYQFTNENLRYFAVLKAMGAGRGTLLRMIGLQAILVGLIGYGIGLGGASAFSLLGRKPGSELSTFFPWQLMLAAFLAMILCVLLGSLLSLRKVLRVDPAQIFT